MIDDFCDKRSACNMILGTLLKVQQYITDGQCSDLRQTNFNPILAY